MAFDLTDYVTVPERVAHFYSNYPDGRIISGSPEIRIIGDRAFIEVTTSVYRTPDDLTPCVASAWEPFPGRTPYTKDSEMMNAETSAIGRALAAAGIAVNKSLASANEIRNRQEPQQPQRPPQKAQSRPQTPAAPHAPSDVVDALVSRLSSLPESQRREAKDLFVRKFGKPSELTADRVDEATEFVDAVTSV